MASPTDLATFSHAELIARITSLETRLKNTTDQLSQLRSHASVNTNTNTSTITSTPAPAPVLKPKYKPRKQPNPFDFSSYHTRRIALRFSYIGATYNGYEHANNESSAPPKPTIEEVLWKALRKTRLIDPSVPEGADESYDVLWDEGKRAVQYGRGHAQGKGKGTQRLMLNWDGVEYSKCGRTDRGVSAFGQVVGLTVRSGRRKDGRKKEAVAEEGGPKVGEKSVIEDGSGEGYDGVNAGVQIQEGVGVAEGDTYANADADTEPEPEPEPEWDPIHDELPYATLLNNVLPPSIRVLAWCPNPPPDFDARFSCSGRRYKYFFTNPAFCPTPGLTGLLAADGTPADARDGWLDIDAMRAAAKKLEGLHDYRNFCKIDATKQMSSCERRIRFTDVEEFDDGMDVFMSDPSLNQRGSQINGALANFVSQTVDTTHAPKVYAFVVDGTAFLWHQVRCMVAVLFLVGQGLEKPEIVDELLDIAKNPRRPVYEMADDGPLVLWDCYFNDVNGNDALQWVYAGDTAATSGPLAARGEDRFSPSGLVTSLWAGWQQAKINETLAAGLLSLSLKQGNRTAFDRGDVAVSASAAPSQRVFSGAPAPRLVGLYQPVMKKAKMDTLEVLNEKYRLGKQARQSAKKSQQAEGGGDE